MSAAASTTSHLDLDLEALRETFPILRPSATFPKGLTKRELMKSPIVDFLTFLTGSKKHNGAPRSGLIVGHFGRGKTSEVLFALKLFGLRVVYMHAPTTSVDRWIIVTPVWSTEPGEENDPSKITLVEIQDVSLLDGPFVLVIDEPSEAHPAEKAMLMEILQDGSINGQFLENLICSVAMINPPGGQYGYSQGFDIAAADRFFTLDLTQESAPVGLWRYAIASDQRLGINQRDLTGFFAAYDKWVARSAHVAELFPPRLLEFTLLAMLVGVPPQGCLPARNDGQHMALLDESGADVTDQVFADLAAGLGVTLVPSLGEHAMRRLVRLSVELGENLEIVGPHGVGKTSGIDNAVREAYAELYPGRELNLISYSAPTTQPDSLVAPIPLNGELHSLIARRFTEGDHIVLRVDEETRASRSIQAKNMEIRQQRMLAGHPLNLLSYIATNNPKEHFGVRYDVGTPSMPMQTRYWYHLYVTSADTDWAEALLSSARDEDEHSIIELFVQWFKEALNDAERALFPPRSVEKAIDLYLEGRPIEWALTFHEGRPVPVPLHDLKTMLAARPLARLSAVARDIERYEKALSSDDQAYNDDRAAVFVSIHKAEMSQLRAHRDVLVRLLPILGSDYKLNLIMDAASSAERQKFIADALKEGTRIRHGAAAEADTATA